MSLINNFTLKDGPQLDAFGRLRVSQIETIFDSKLLYDAAPLFWNDVQTSGTATSAHSTAEAAVTLTVNLNTAGVRTRQTFMRFNYQPGKSQLILITFVLDASGGGTGITRRVGLYDTNNGLFLADVEGVYNFTRRTYVSGSPVDTAVTQANWNLDKMDGTGASGITLDFTKTQILVIDYEWLGVGRVRLGFNVGGNTYYAHEFLNTNVLTTVYMSTPNLPIRYELINDGNGVASTMKCICATVNSEGGTQNLGIIRYASTDGTHVDANTENTIYAVIGIRLKSTHIGSSIKIINASVQIQTGSHKVEWLLLLNPTVADVFTYADETNSAVQTAKGATANEVSNGYKIAGGFAESGGVQGGNAGSGGADVNNAILLGSTIAGVVDTIVLAVRPIGGSSNVDIEGSLVWREL